ncbi:hypothetical protein GCM10012275_09000 [Longimycelium tulufanense]|uniref:Transcriptional regulator n=1 Tax=Longimycelium tulufanense TaxID=907463 RepID=A0A8J3C8D2_9PSEU|nr:hypothetical protein GCM10012275_09000 [Longimycelium tulufanense]
MHYSKGHLGKVETGGKAVGIDLARRCDAALEADGQLAALVARPSSDSPPPATETAHDDEVWVMAMEPDGSSRMVPMRRRQVLTAGAASLLGLNLTPQGISATAQQDATIAAFRSLFEQIRQLGQTTSPGVVLPTVVAQTHTLRGLATGASSRTRQDLLRLAARYAEYAGWMTQEAGDDRGALWWTRVAVEMSAAAGDTELSTYALVRQALLTLYREDAAGTIDLAQQAQADHHASARTRGLAALREAQGHALACDYDECWRALDRATVLLDDAGEHAHGDLVVGSASVTGSGLSAVVAGWCLHDLGRPHRAGDILDQQLAHVPDTARRVHARFGARRALAYATAAEVDHACALTHRVLDSAELVDSATIRVDLRRLARTLSRWHNHRPVRELFPRLTAALRMSIA